MAINKTLKDLEELTRWIVAEKTTGQLQETPDIFRAINDEQTSLYNDIVQAFEDYFCVSSTTVITKDIDKYDLRTLPLDWSKVRYVEREDTNGNKFPIFPMEISDLLAYDNGFNGGTPERFLIKKDDMILRFIPNKTGDLLRVFYIHLPIKMLLDGDFPIIPAEHHELLAWGAAIRCLYREGISPNAIRVHYDFLLTKLLSAVEERQIMEPRYVKDYEDIYNDRGYAEVYY